MATNTSHIIDLEAQMAAVQLKLYSEDQDLKDAIAALAASTKDHIDALTVTFAHSREKSSVHSRLTLSLTFPIINTFVLNIDDRQFLIITLAWSFATSLVWILMCG
ncbi:unnamed protein product [Linum trigynum]|uniref:Uncharacterized protein n=1 Tax=Linum trigynum TaxID=586398 RepID=A0AAV2E240_9ROSI